MSEFGQAKDRVTAKIGVDASLREAEGTGSRMYVGTLDDSVSRHPWPGHKANAAYVKALLIDSALFGIPLCARLGNILYHDAYYDALINPNESPLQGFARSGFLQLQMRCQTINETIESRLSEGTNSTIDFVKAHDWKKNSKAYRELSAFDGTLTMGLGKTLYSGNFRPFFRRLMHETRDVAPPEFAVVYDVWAKRDANELTRSNFEIDALKALNEDKELVRRAMWAANTANHNAYGLGMSDLSQAGKIMVETSELDRHIDLVAVDEPIEVAQTGEIIAKADIIEMALAEISIPEEVYLPEYWAKLGEIVSPILSRAKSEYRDFNYVKEDLLNIIGRSVNSPERLDKGELIKRCMNYNAALRAALGVSGDRSLNAQGKIFLQALRARAPKAAATGGASAATGVAVDLATTGGMGTLAGLAVGVGLGVADYKNPNPIRRLNTTLKRSIFSREVVQPTDAGEHAEIDRIQSEQTIRPYAETVGVKEISPIKTAKRRKEEGLDT